MSTAAIRNAIIYSFRFIVLEGFLRCILYPLSSSKRFIREFSSSGSKSSQHICTVCCWRFTWAFFTQGISITVSLTIRVHDLQCMPVTWSVCVFSIFFWIINYNLILLSLKLLVTTLTLLRAIAKPAKIGLSMSG